MKKTFIFPVALAMLATNVYAETECPAGKTCYSCGNDCLSYTTDIEGGGKQLNVIGTGGMWSTGYTGSDITSVVIEEGIRTLYDYTFSERPNIITSLSLPQSLTNIYDFSFRGLNGLVNLTVPDLNMEGFPTISRSFADANPSNLTISADMLQEFLKRDGSFKSGDLNITCTSGDCAAVLSAWDASQGTAYALRANISSLGQNAQGGNSHKAKRIYTIEEAEKLSKPTGNKIMLRYR